MRENWDDKYEYLRDSYSLYHNDDYIQFLVRTVWGLDKRSDVVEFGCGYGRMGLVLMSLLPQGSTYTGIDVSESLLQKGREAYAELPYAARFINCAGQTHLNFVVG